VTRRTVGRSVGCSGSAGAGALEALGLWGSVGLAGWLVGWWPRQDWSGRVWIKTDFSCRLAQQQRRSSVESGSEVGFEMDRVVHRLGAAASRCSRRKARPGVSWSWDGEKGKKEGTGNRSEGDPHYNDIGGGVAVNLWV
jgi:hypothetical protein